MASPNVTPLETLATWLAEAEAAGVPEPAAMALATVSPSGAPSVRYVLCRGVDGRGMLSMRHSMVADRLALRVASRMQPRQQAFQSGIAKNAHNSKSSFIHRSDTEMQMQVRAGDPVLQNNPTEITIQNTENPSPAC